MGSALFFEYSSSATVQFVGNAEQWKTAAKNICQDGRLNLSETMISAFDVDTKNSWRKLNCSLGLLSIQWISENTYRLSSSNKKIISIIANTLHAKKTTARKTRPSPYTAGDCLSILIFGAITLILLLVFLNAINDVSIDLKSEARVLQASVSVLFSSKGKTLRSRGTRFLDFKLEGLKHQFRFAPKENYEVLLKEMVKGEKITLYYSLHGYDIYQIEKNGRVLYPKSVFENGNIVVVLMGFIFLMFAGGATWFLIRRPLRK